MPCGAIVASIVLVALHTDIVPCQLKQLLNSPCVTAVLVIDHRQVTQLFLPALHSAGTLHLAYTVLSLLGLGYHLEHRMGTLRFLGAIFGLTVLINVAFCLMTYIILPNFEEVAGVLAFEMPYKCFIGLTATLIAMKGVYTVYYPTSSYLFLCILVPVPKLLGPLFEVAILHFALPYVWIVGNVIGFCIGLLAILS